MRDMFRKRWAIIAVCGLVSIFAAALHGAPQAPSQNSQTPDDSSQPVIVELISSDVSFHDDGTSESDTKIRIRIQSQLGVQEYGLLRFPYPSSTSSLDILYVKAIGSDGTEVTTPPDDVQDLTADITREAPLYSDLKEKHVPVKGLKIGDALEYRVHSQMHAPLMPGQFWFEYNFDRAEIVQQEILRISVPATRKVNLNSPDVAPSIAQENGFTVYTWKTANLTLKKAEKNSRQTGKSKPPAIQMSSLNSWGAVAQWYGSLSEPEVQPNPDVDKKAQSLIKNAQTEAEKIRLLYNFVSTQIRYIGVDFGIGRYQPHTASEVLSNGYGDCKDKDTLLRALLAASGIESDSALVNANRDIDPEVPSPSQFDHVVTVVPEGKNLLWLDTTTEVAPPGFLVAALRAKKSLLIPAEGEGTLVESPADPPIKSLVDFHIKGKLNDAGTLEASVQVKFQADTEVPMRLAFRNSSPSQWTEVVQNVSYALGFVGTVSNVIVSSPEKTDEPFQIAYSYERKDYGDWPNKRITPPLPPIVLIDPGDDESNSSEPIELGPLSELDEESEIELPENFSALIRAGVSLKKNFGEYDSTYSQDQGVLHATRRFASLLREVPAIGRSDFLAFRNAVINDQSQFILLSDRSSNLGSLVRGMSENQTAAELFREAQQDLQQKHFEDAIKSLRQAVKSDPSFTLAYQAMAYALMAMRKQEEALEPWKQVEKLDPDNANAPANMGTIYLGMDRYDEAIKQLEDAVSRGGGSSYLSLQLGRAYIRSGKKDEGILMLKQVLKQDDSPKMLNDVAYELADNNVELHNALDYAEHAVEEQEDDTSDLSLDPLTIEDLQRMSALAAYWDTLGWVHFRLGHFPEAVRYLKAAWDLSQDPTNADHLGQVAEKQGKPADAAHCYALAIAAGSTPPETRARLAKLLGRTENADRKVNAARSELTSLRSTEMSWPASGKAAGEFFILFDSDADTIPVAKFINGSDELRNVSKAVSAAAPKPDFPDLHETRLVRRGLVDCEAGSKTCLIILIPPVSVTSIN